MISQHPDDDERPGAPEPPEQREIRRLFEETFRSMGVVDPDELQVLVDRALILPLLIARQSRRAGEN